MSRRYRYAMQHLVDPVDREPLVSGLEDESGFTLAELCALYLSRHLLESVAGSPFQRDLTNAFARLGKILSPRMRATAAS